jgi:anti-sigma factor RsiW
MRCDELRDLLDLHMDGELPIETTRKMERHLLRCQSCAYELHTLQQTRAMLREAVAPSETTLQFRERALGRLTDRLAPNARPAAVNARQWILPFKEDFK